MVSTLIVLSKGLNEITLQNTPSTIPEIYGNSHYFSLVSILNCLWTLGKSQMLSRPQDHSAKVKMLTPQVPFSSIPTRQSLWNRLCPPTKREGDVNAEREEKKQKRQMVQERMDSGKDGQWVQESMGSGSGTQVCMAAWPLFRSPVVSSANVTTWARFFHRY